MSNVFVRVSRLASLVLFAPLLAVGGVSEKWVAETTEISPHEITAYHGETVNMTVTFTENGRIIRPSSASASFLWQTNGMGTAWWSTNATYKCGVVTGSFGPTMDTGAADVTFFFWVTDGKGGNYRANGTINLLDSPFFDIHILGTPTKILDFGLVSVTNADLAPFALKGDAGGVTTNDVTSIISNTVTDNYIIDRIGSIGGITAKIATNIASNVAAAMKPTKLGSYLWEVGTEGEDWDVATNRLAKVYPSWGGGCSGVKYGNYHGRNLDWYYDKGASIIVRSPAREGKYGAIGVAGGLKVLTDDFMMSEKWDDSYYSLPFTWTDGMNEKGVVIQSNVIPKDTAKSATWRTKRSGSIVCFAIIRYVLDRCATAYEAAVMLNEKMFMPSEFNYDDHFLVSDLTSSYIVEDGHIYSASDIPTDLLTNFRCGTASYNANKTVQWNTVETYGQGLERYDLVRTNGNDNTTLNGLVATMKGLWYTKSYLPTTSPYWYTECCGPESETGYPNLTVMNAKTNQSVFAGIVSSERADYLAEHDATSSQYRGGKTWQTVHTAIYDQQNLTLRLFTQEDPTSERLFKLVKDSADIVVPSTSTNDVNSLIDGAFVGGTQNVNRVVCSFDSVSNKVDTIQGELHTNVTLLVENKTLSIREGESNIWSSTEAAAQVQSNWAETDTSSKAYIQNKPTIPAAQVQSDWNVTDTSSKAYIQNKPTIPAVQVQSDWSETNTSSKAYIQNKPTIPAAQVQSDWSETNTSSKAYIQNKPENAVLQNSSQSQTILKFDSGTFMNASEGEFVIGGDQYANGSDVSSVVSGYSLNKLEDEIQELKSKAEVYKDYESVYFDTPYSYCNLKNKAKNIINDAFQYDYAYSLIIPDDDDIELYVEIGHEITQSIRLYDFKRRKIYKSYEGTFGEIDKESRYHIFSNGGNICVTKEKVPQVEVLTNWIEELSESNLLFKAEFEFNFPYMNFMYTGYNYRKKELTKSKISVINHVHWDLKNVSYNNNSKVTFSTPLYVAKIITPSGSTNTVSDSYTFKENGVYEVSLYCVDKYDSTQSSIDTFSGFLGTVAYFDTVHSYYTPNSNFEYLKSVKFGDLVTKIGYIYNHSNPELVTEKLNLPGILITKLVQFSEPFSHVREIDLNNVKSLNRQVFCNSYFTNLNLSAISNFTCECSYGSPLMDMPYLTELTLPTNFESCVSTTNFEFLFYGNHKLKSIKGWKNMFSYPWVFNRGSFEYCYDFPFGNLDAENALYVGAATFASCYGMESFCGKNVKYVDSSGFFDCSNLHNATINNATNIGEFAFFNATALTNVTMTSVKHIGGEYVFSNIKNYVDVNITGSTKEEVRTNWGHDDYYPFGLKKGCFHCSDGDLTVGSYTSKALNEEVDDRGIEEKKKLKVAIPKPLREYEEITDTDEMSRSHRLNNLGYKLFRRNPNFERK